MMDSGFFQTLFDVFSTGVSAGIILAFFPFLVGCVIGLAMKIMKGG